MLNKKKIVKIILIVSIIAVAIYIAKDGDLSQLGLSSDKNK
jgi:hypothetical protein